MTYQNDREAGSHTSVELTMNSFSGILTSQSLILQLHGDLLAMVYSRSLKCG